MIIGYSSKIQGLFWPFSAVSIVGRYSPIQLELARFNANRPESKPRRRESWTKKTRGRMRPDAAPTCRQRRPLRVAVSDVGVAPLEPRPCFPDSS